MKKKLLYIIVSLLLLNIFSATPAKANNLKVRIDQPISDNFPDMKVYVSVTDKNHKSEQSLVKQNFSVFVDGQKIESGIDVAGFQYSEEGIAYSLLIASNGIMEGEPLHQQLKAAVHLLESLREQDTLSVYNYGDKIIPIFENQSKKDSLGDKISKIEAVGGNPRFNDALVSVVQKAQKASLKRKVIIVMGDGRENESRYNKTQLRNIIDEANIPIYSLGMKIMDGNNLFRIASISKRSGGSYIYARNIKTLPNLIRVLNQEIQLGYIIKFDASKTEADNKIHQLEIKIQQGTNKSSFAKNFIAVKIPLSFWIMVVFIILAIIILIVLSFAFIIYRRRMRKRMGITKRKCPVCRKRLKDDWDECMFCKYLPPKKKKKKILKEKMA